MALGLVFVGCLGMYWGNSFTSVRILFACVGISFADYQSVRLFIDRAGYE